MTKHPPTITLYNPDIGGYHNDTISFSFSVLLAIDTQQLISCKMNYCRPYVYVLHEVDNFCCFQEGFITESSENSTLAVVDISFTTS